RSCFIEGGAYGQKQELCRVSWETWAVDDIVRNAAYNPPMLKVRRYLRADSFSGSQRFKRAREGIVSGGEDVTGAESGRALDLQPAGATGRGAEDAEIAWRNGERIVAEPGLVLAALMRERSSFTGQELERFVKANTVRAEQFATALARVESSVEIVRLGNGANGEEIFSRRPVGSIAAPRESCHGFPPGEPEGEKASVVSLREAAAVVAACEARHEGLPYWGTVRP